ncbi:MAG TPA: hypothetical protein VE170_16505 [Candidatus Limnocylindria bacterium]|nr:hypothetical protein [Candidatus Limnocylindria bacterium]
MRRSFVEVHGSALAFGLESTARWVVGRSAVPSDPYDPRRIPQGARFHDKRTFLGEICCRTMSLLSSDAKYERWPECIALVQSNGAKVGQCGSVPGSTPRS